MNFSNSITKNITYEFYITVIVNIEMNCNESPSVQCFVMQTLNKDYITKSQKHILIYLLSK